jgi:O-antigen/teichoic acid export membrane protein
MVRFFKEFGYAPALLVPRAVALIVVVIFTRLLTPEQFGLYALIIVYGELLDAVMLSWNRLAFLRFYYRSDSQKAGDLMPGAVLVLAVGLLLGAGGGAAIAISAKATASFVFYLLLMLYFVANGLLRFSLNILRARERLTLYVVLEIIRPLLGLLAAWILVQAQGAVYTWLVIGMFGVTAIFSLTLFISSLNGFRWGGADWPLFWEMMRYGAPLLMVFLWAQVINVSDRFLLNLLSGSAAVGVYAAGYALAKPSLEILFNIVNLGAFPQLVKAYEQGERESAREVLRSKVSMMLFLCIPTLAAIILLAEPLADILLGEAYRENAPAVMRLAGFAAFFAGLKSFVFDQVFHLERKSMLQGYTLVPAVIVNVGLNLLLIPSYGVVGAAWATLTGYVVAAVLSAYYSRRYIKIQWPVRKLIWIATGTVIMGLVILLVQHQTSSLQLLLSLPIAVAIYLIVCWKGNVLHIDAEISVVQGVKMK